MDAIIKTKLIFDKILKSTTVRIQTYHKFYTTGAISFASDIHVRLTF